MVMCRASTITSTATSNARLSFHDRLTLRSLSRGCSFGWEALNSRSRVLDTNNRDKDMDTDKGSQTRRTRNVPVGRNGHERRNGYRERSDRAQKSGYGSGHREMRNHGRLRNG